jgi:hypothetical protein
MDNSKQFWAGAFARQLHADFDGGVESITENFKRALATSGDEKACFTSWARQYANGDAEKIADTLEKALNEINKTTIGTNSGKRLHQKIERQHNLIDKLSVEVNGHDFTDEARSKAHATLPAHVKERTMIECTAKFKGKKIPIELTVAKNNNNL